VCSGIKAFLAARRSSGDAGGELNGTQGGTPMTWKTASKDDAAGKIVNETLPVLQKHPQTAQSLARK
jgi:hypothetical protein